MTFFSPSFQNSAFRIQNFFGALGEKKMPSNSSKSKAQSAPTRPTILVVDDEPQVLELAADVVGREIDCNLLTATGVREAARLIESEAIDVLLADVHLPDGNGLSLLSTLQANRPAAGAVVITGQPTLAKAIDAIRAGVLDFLPKPFSSDQLLERVRLAVAQQADTAHKADRVARLKRARSRKCGSPRRSAKCAARRGTSSSSSATAWTGSSRTPATATSRSGSPARSANTSWART
jgi:DNA-binding NtrC family response regulator